jgi:hypothetical protein
MQHLNSNSTLVKGPTIMKRKSNSQHLISESPARLWTVVTLVDGQISSSVHPTEYQAYREAVSRFIYVEPDSMQNSQTLKHLLDVAVSHDDFQIVRRYIADHASKISFMQLAEHNVSKSSQLWMAVV